MGISNKERIAAVVVTYNRKQLLVECLNALLKQTHHLDAIYIIDNASTDGTPDYLNENNFIDKTSDMDNDLHQSTKTLPFPPVPDRTVKICYVRMYENTGGAGGFHEGVKRAYEEGYDWLWLMDDDIEPLPDALGVMLAFHPYSKAIHSMKVYNDGEIDSPGYWLNSWTGLCKPIKDERKVLKAGQYVGKIVNIGSFEGMLIHKDIVSKIGYPNPGFFIWHDDIVYGFLASSHTLVIFVKKICFIKKIRNPGLGLSIRMGIMPERCYYWLRNYLLVSEYICSITSYGSIKRIVHYLIFSYLFVKLSIGGLIYCKDKKDMAIVIEAFKDGTQKKWGKRLTAIKQDNQEIIIPMQR